MEKEIKDGNIREMTYERLALALAGDYESLYYVNTEDSSYVEYRKGIGSDQLAVVSSGEDFFADSVMNCNILVYEEDRGKFLEAFRRENVLETLAGGKAFTLDYRLIIDGEPQHYSLKTIRGIDDKFVVIGVRCVEEQYLRERKVKEERRTYSQIANALASRYEVIYYISTKTNHYIQYNASAEYSKLGIEASGDDFFTAAAVDTRKYIYPEDIERVGAALERDTLLGKLSLNGSYSLTYRQLFEGVPQYVTMNVICPKNDEEHIVIGVMNIDAVMRKELEYMEKLGSAMEQASKDGLTGVKNKHAFLRAEEELDRHISDGICGEFAVVVSDMNGLKLINDSLGHNVGDEYIKEACRIICKIFSHSPVFRVGGDEFAVILRGEDFDSRTALTKALEELVESNRKAGLVTIAYGMSEFDRSRDRSMRAVFDRADNAMYENKKHFKCRGSI